MRVRVGPQSPGPYLRRPLAGWAPSDTDTSGGPHRGIEFANVAPLIGNLCIRPEGGVDVAMYLALTTTLPLDAALDLAEIDNVSRSHRDAAHANATYRRARKAANRVRLRAARGEP